MQVIAVRKLCVYHMIANVSADNLLECYAAADKCCETAIKDACVAFMTHGLNRYSSNCSSMSLRNKPISELHACLMLCCLSTPVMVPCFPVVRAIMSQTRQSCGCSSEIVKQPAMEELMGNQPKAMQELWLSVLARQQARE